MPTPWITKKRLAWSAVPVALLAALAWTIPASADDEHERHEDRKDRSSQRVRGGTQAMPAVYRSECGSCHLAYPAQWLPASSWQRINNNLASHYGTDASVDAATLKTVTAWLTANAADARRTPAPPQDRITRTRWFAHEHDEIAAATFRRPSVRSAANCAACHPGAERGDFDEDSVRIPR